jgi:Protein of unknown function (DUF2380)
LRPSLAVLPLAVAVAVVGIAQALPAAAVAAPAPTLAILPFDLVDYSLDQRPVTTVPLRAWVSALPAEIGADLRGSPEFAPLNDPAIQPAYGKLATSYQHPTTCHPCMLALGKAAHADYILIGQVNKVSNLLTYFDVQIAAVGTGKTVALIEMRADGANSAIMWSRIAHSMACRIERAAIPGVARQSPAAPCAAAPEP